MDDLWKTTGLPLMSDTIPHTEGAWTGMAPTVAYQAETPPDDILAQQIMCVFFAWMMHVPSSTVPAKAQEA